MMRANLARHARRLLVRRAVAPRFALYSSLARRPAIASSSVPRQFRRTFLNALFSKPPREVREPEYEPGWMDIMMWRSRMLDNLRPQAGTELRDAWNALMTSKRRNHAPLNSTQALQCRRLLEYLGGKHAKSPEETLLSTADLSMARSVLLDLDPLDRSQNHRDLAKALYNVWCSGNISGEVGPVEQQWGYLLKALAKYGGSQEALQMLYSKWDDPAYKTYLSNEHRLVEAVAEGLATEGSEKDLVDLIQYADTNGVPYNARLQKIIVDFFAKRDRVVETQHWLNKDHGDKHSLPETYRVVASFAKRNQLQAWAIPLFLELGKQQPDQDHWDTILQAILILGKSLEEVKKMMSHMVSTSTRLAPNTSTINGLLRVAVELRDGNLAQDILSLGAEKGVTPDGETSLILWELQLVTGDLIAAQALFTEVTRAEPWNNGPDASVLYADYRQLSNQFLVALCRQRRPDFNVILKVLSMIEEGQVGLMPETVALLCLRCLENDQNFDVMDILSIYSFRYSEEQRKVVQDAFLKFCLDPSTSTARAWGAYQVLDQYFQDLSFESRNNLMDTFFSRKRPDMATHVISRMARHRNKSFHPTMDTYVRCFEGYARHPDLDGLQVIHNLLKTDTSIQPNTRLLTSLLLAYTGCEKSFRALDFWDEIIKSPEGPSYATLEAVFWTLEQRANGATQARDIWEKIVRMDLEVPPAVYNAYIGAIANGALETEVRNLIMNMASVVGSEPDAMTIGIAYNALPGPSHQSRFEDWASKKYRSIWAELLKKGRTKGEYSLCRFRINRILKG